MSQITVSPFSFDNIPVRGTIIRIDEIATFCPTLAKAPQAIRESIAQLLTANVCIQNDINIEAGVTLQIHSKSDVSLMVSQCSAAGNLRAYAQFDAETVKADINFRQIAENDGYFALNVEQKDQQPLQSLVHLNPSSVKASIADYLNQASGLKTYFKVFTEDDGENLKAGAILLQQLAGGGNASAQQAEELAQDDWNRLGMLISTIKTEEITTGEIDENTLLTRLFSKDDEIRVMPKKYMQFEKLNVRERMQAALTQVGIEECKKLLENGDITMNCKFTGKQEIFTESDLKQFFGANWQQD